MKIAGFRGLDNIRESASFLVDKAGIVTPRCILNADVSSDGRLKKRGGYTKLFSLSNPHSLSKNCSILLCIAGNKLCKLTKGGYTEICEVITDSMSYVELGNYIYLSCPAWTGKYNLITDSVEQWGVELPPIPSITLNSSGDLPPGRYAICYTQITNDLMGGNGGIGVFEFEGENKGVTLLNFSDSYRCWLTDTNGKDFYLADVQSNEIISPYYNVPLQSMFVIPPPKMSILAHAFGRIWGIQGATLYYSEAHAYDWFKQTNQFLLPGKLIMIAPTQTAIFVASKTNTWVLVGTDPQKMTMQRVGDGSITGCPTYGNFQQSGQEVPTWRHKSVLPIWLGPNGFTVGNEHFQLTSLTEGRVNLTLGDRAAILQRNVDGQMQTLISMPVSEGILDDVFLMKRPFMPEAFDLTGSSGVIIS